MELNAKVSASSIENRDWPGNDLLSIEIRVYGRQLKHVVNGHCPLGQVKFPNFLNTAPKMLYMVDLVRVNAKKIELKVSNQLQFGLL